MKIMNLHVENIKRIKVVDITPKGNTVLITGQNGNGKSSTIDSIAWALGGKSLIPAKPIRDGEKTGEIKIDLGQYVVTRNWTSPETSYLTVDTKDGGSLRAPQETLNRLIGDLSFDPLEFTAMDPKKRFELLRKITGINFTELDKEYEEKFIERRGVKKYLAEAQTLIKDQPEIEKPPTPVDLSPLQEKQRQAYDHNRRIEQSKQEVSDIKNQLKSFSVLMKEYREDFDRLEAEKKRLNTKMERGLKLIAEQDELLKAKLPGAEKELMDVDETQKAINDCLEERRLHEEYLTKKARTDSIEESAQKYTTQTTELTERLEQIIKAKAVVMQETKMPIDGLDFGENEILFNRIPFGQLAMSEQIRVSVAIAMAQNPKLKIVIINNGSLLDQAALDMVSKLADKNDFQVWIERVAERAEGNSIYIEDGQVHNVQ